MRAVCEDLHSRVPDNMVEKASSMAALQSLLEYHYSFSREVERESSALTLLRHHVLNLFLHPHASASTTDRKHNQDNPCLLEIQSIQENYDKYEYLSIGLSLFCSVLFCSVLFCSVLFCSVCHSVCPTAQERVINPLNVVIKL